MPKYRYFTKEARRSPGLCLSSRAQTLKLSSKHSTYAVRYKSTHLSRAQAFETTQNLASYIQRVKNIISKYAANLRILVTQVNSSSWYTEGLAWVCRSIAVCLLLKTCLELLSLKSDKYWSFEETITGDYGNQTMNWNTYSSQKNPRIHLR